ncbi:MAG: GNAT family N-acetyltransferase [Gemmatimonadetes bacterium]|nr:GNAT family N-acetyltransferase [Gemmatimonadota bacterium]
MVTLVWSDGRIAVRAVEPSQTPALHAAFLECSDAALVDPTFGEVPESEIGELVERSTAEDSQERGFRMRSIHVGTAGDLAGYFHLMEDVPASGDVWLSILAIRPRFRGSGVGTAVFARLKRELAARGFPFALARVYLANVPALRFWMRQGFTEVVPHRGEFVGCELGNYCIVLRASLEG